MPLQGIPVVGHKFVERGKYGDFGVMVKMQQHRKTLFVIMENFIDSIRDDVSNGGGTACIRKMCVQHLSDSDISKGVAPRAVGIPTGWSIETEGFPHMDRLHIKRAIDLSIERMIIVLHTYKYDEIVFSADSDDPTVVGTGIFKESIGQDVVRYISDKLNSLSTSIPDTRLALDTIREQEYKLLPYALSVDGNSRRDAEISRCNKEIDRLKALLTKNGIDHKPPRATLGKAISKPIRPQQRASQGAQSRFSQSRLVL